MFVVFISVVCLIISIFLVMVLFNVTMKFVYCVTKQTLYDYPVTLYVFVGILLALLWFLANDMVQSVLLLF